MSGVAVIGVDRPEHAVERLASKGIVVRSLPDPQAVRASIHAVNTETDVDRLVDSLRREF